MTTPTDIPVRGQETVEDAWNTYAENAQKERDEKAKAAITADAPAGTEELLSFLESESDSIWDNPKLQGFFSFVQTKIEQLAEFKRNIQDINNVTLQELNVALFQHNETYNSLVSLYNIAATEEEVVKMDFQLWFDEKYTEARALLNPPNLSSMKWASTKEIESYVRTKNKEGFRQRRVAVIAAERQTAFCRRLMEGWDGLKFSLNTISKNQQIQYRDSIPAFD